MNPKDDELRKKCEVCGKIYCFTVGDLMSSQGSKGAARLNQIGAFGQMLGGSLLGAHVMGAAAERERAQVVDYDRCPNCGSRNTKFVPKDKW